MSRPRAARLAFDRGECAEPVVMRAFMEHTEWLAPAWLFDKATEGRKVCFDGQHVVPEGELWVFTEAATATHASQSGTRLGTYVSGIPGTELFGALMKDSAAVRINPGGYTEDELRFTPDAYGGLTEWATGIAVERGLPYVTEGVFSETMIQRLRTHPRYYLPFFSDGRMISKPGYGGFDQPGVLCVTPDAYDAFTGALDETLVEQIEQVIATPEELKQHVEKQKIDGVYFNPMGPGPSTVLPASAFSAL